MTLIVGNPCRTVKALASVAVSVPVVTVTDIAPGVAPLLTVTDTSTGEERSEEVLLKAK